MAVSMGLVSPREANLHYSIIPICRSAPSITIKDHTGVPYKADVGGQMLAKHGVGYFVANRFRGDLEKICVLLGCKWLPRTQGNLSPTPVVGDCRPLQRSFLARIRGKHPSKVALKFAGSRAHPQTWPPHRPPHKRPNKNGSHIGRLTSARKKWL